ncbi:MAG: double-strand break repair protein AddB [Alphaproteobacteria bacterium]
MRAKNIYNIPPGLPFAESLARQLLEETRGTPETLSRYLMLLPTRRACRTLQETFLELNEGRPLLLPRLQPLGDVDEEELSLSMEIGGVAAFMDVPPALSALKRQALLAKLIAADQARTRSFERALALAEALGRFLDQIYIEGLDFSNLAALVPEEFSQHWQITTEFLKILSEHWPLILQEQKSIDSADRRNRLMRLLKTHWQNNPPDYPVIAAGSTGSIPATAELLEVIAALPQGRVVLPGLEIGMDDESWDAMENTHPQAALKRLLARMNIDRNDVKPWAEKSCPVLAARRELACEMMRPAATTQSWMHLATDKMRKKSLSRALENLSLFECSSENEEATGIALLLRETLETKNKTAVLITPDRILARRVAAACRAWNIKIDDSAGLPLGQAQIGVFLRLVLAARRTHYAPVALLSLLQHPYARLNLPPQARAHALIEVDEKLRGLNPAPGLGGLAERVGADHPPCTILRQCFTNTQKQAHNFADWVNEHLQACEIIAAAPGEDGADFLWRGEDGEAAAKFFAGLRDESHHFPPVNIQDYETTLLTMMNTVAVRPNWGTHPRLKILGQLEARMIQGDRVILGGLNEGTWPPDPGHDPWMSRPMREQFGLPSPDEAVARAAHDFMQGFCAGEVILTRARKKDGAPTVPARWLQRLDTVLKAGGIDPIRLRDARTLSWARKMHEAAEFAPVSRPMPAPPVESRPKSLRVTRIETWLKDPYGIYAEYILDLKKLKPLEQEIDATERGILLHNILEEFTARFPETLPPDVENILIEIAREHIASYHADQAAWSFWQPRFERLARAFIKIETAWRTRVKPSVREARGELSIETPRGNFILHAKADRIDSIGDEAAIIDYKSGGKFTAGKIKSGEYPQLPLEALILRAGGFAGMKPADVNSLSYWVLTGGSKPGEVTEVTDDLEDALARAENGLKNLIAVFENSATPYINLPHADRLPRFNDYEHLARVREWSVFGDEIDDAGSEAA